MLVIQFTKRTGGRRGIVVPVQSPFHTGHDSFASGSERDALLDSSHGNVWEGVYQQDKNPTFAG